MRRWIRSAVGLAALIFLTCMPAGADLSQEATRIRGGVVLVLNQTDGGPGMGTAFAVARKGSGLWLITCEHVVSNPGTPWLWAEGMEAPVSARVLARDPEADLALLHAQGLQATPLALAPPGTVRVGQSLGVIGFPRVDVFAGSGMEVTASLTRGIVSALRTREVSVQNRVPFIQTDAVLNPGNSGGPALDWETSQVIGVATATMRDMQGAGLLVSVEAVHEFLARHGVPLPGKSLRQTPRPVAHRARTPRTGIPQGQSPPPPAGTRFPPVAVLLGLILVLAVLGLGLWSVLRGGPTDPPDPGPAV